ncbi:MAG: tetratricopeptide repeat protein [Cyclobacteriaceae bacterium]
MGKVLSCLLILFAQLLFAQQPVHQQSPDKLYSEGLRHFEEKAYYVSINLLEAYKADGDDKTFETEADFYLALSKLKIGDKSAMSDLETFSANNKSHPLKSLANYFLGSYYFDKKDYSKTLKYFDQVAEDQLDKDAIKAFVFKRGYAKMIKGEDIEALIDFRRVSLYHDQYYQESIYYAGLIQTSAKQFSDALDILSGSDDSEGSYTSLIVELTANIYYQTGDHSKLIQYASQHLSEKPSQTNRTLNRLLGETYFQKEEFRLASRHLQRHLDFSKNRMDADGYYKLGFSYYKIKDSPKAIDNFKLSALEKGSLGQISSFYLGRLYLESKNYTYALSAFNSAMNSDEDAGIKEESTFLSGKVNYSSGQYKEAIIALTKFNEMYSSSRWSLEASELLTKSYLKTSDYDQAIGHIEETPNKSYVIKEAYQTLCFHKGQQLFNDSKFKEAISYLQKSLLYPVKQEVKSETLYLLGESFSLTNEKAKARESFNLCIESNANSPWAPQSYYGLGYIAYNEKQYADAEVNFRNFLNRTSDTHEFFADAKLRLADSYFVQKKYDPSLKIYKKLLGDENTPQDYVNYQIGVIHELNNREEEARKSFANVIAFKGKSSYQDNALFQTGESFISQALFIKAAESFSQLIQNFPESVLVPFSYSKRASCYFNLNQNDASKDDYEFILNNFISHEVANGALLGMQELGKRGVSIDKFDIYMESFRQANPDDSSLEVVAFEAAKNKYYDQRYNAAIVDFKSFIEKYPESSFQIDVQYLLADSYYRNSNWRLASDEFLKLIQQENNAYRSRALDKSGKSFLELKEYNRAVDNYRLLLRYSVNRKEQFIARKGLMNSYFLLSQMDSVLFYTSKILEEDWKPVGAEESVWLLRGKAFFEKTQYDKALDEFIKVLNGPLDENSAEAKYHVAKVYFQKTEYQRSLETLFDLNRNYGSYSRWIGRSFLLIADNYIGLDELLQAKATLQSIVDNSPEEAIVIEARQKILEIEAAEESIIIKDSVEQDSLKIEE